jgi:5-methylthioribose kinase
VNLSDKLHGPELLSIKLFPSIVNRVEMLTTCSGKRLIRKTYPQRAKGTSIEVPIRRADVEVKVLKLLAKLLADFDRLLVPNILAYDLKKPMLCISDLEGETLSNSPPTNWPSTEAWFELGSLLGALNNLQEQAVIEIFSNLVDVQAATRQIILTLKLNMKVYEMEKRFRQTFGGHHNHKNRIFCMGDLGLLNMLSCHNKLGLIDFEFAHMGFPGFDIGQLLAQLSTLSQLTPQCTILIAEKRRALEKGYYKLMGYSGIPQFWECLFLPYYQLKSTMFNKVAEKSGLKVNGG